MKRLLIVTIGLLSCLKAQSFIDVAAINNIDAATTSMDGFGSGVSFYDFNNDGWDDLTFTLESDTQVFYINNHGVFQRADFDLYISGQAKQTLWLDYDNDGDLDLIISVLEGKCHLFQNDGSFNFTDVSVSAGIYPFDAYNYGVSASDYNKDGYLDLYVSKYQPDSTGIQDLNDLYLNNGDGTFTNTTFQAGMTDGVGRTFIGVWIDYNADSWPDLYIINDGGTWDNVLYRNNQDGTFTDVTDSTNTKMPGNDPMTVSVADFDNDQDLDMYVSNTGLHASFLPNFLVNDQNSFTNYADSFDLDLNTTTWGGVWFDFDNNGLQDLYVATSYVNTSFTPERNFFYINDYPNPFIEDSTVFGSSLDRSHAVARGDINNDGFYDIVVQNNAPHQPNLYLNPAVGNNNYIKVSLEGTYSNRFAIGSWIKVYASGKIYTQYTLCGENYIGQNSQHHIIGVKGADVIDSVHVEYLSGIVDRYYNLSVNASYNFTEGETHRPVLNYQDSILICTVNNYELDVLNYGNIEWSNGTTGETTTVNHFGKHWAIYTDSKGFAFYSDTLDVIELHPPEYLLDFISPTCSDLSDGTVWAVLEHNQYNYDISWSNGQLGDSLSNIEAGKLFFNYVDDIGCVIYDSITVDAPPLLDLQFQVTNTDFNSNLNEIAVSVNGGTPPYEIYLDDVLVNDVISDLSEGNYTLEVLDLNGCSFLKDIEIIKLDSIVSGLSDMKQNEFTLYPNPAWNKVMVKSEHEFEELILTGLDGKEIMRTSDSYFFTQNLSSGCYFVHILADTRIISLKLILN